MQQEGHFDVNAIYHIIQQEGNNLLLQARLLVACDVSLTRWDPTTGNVEEIEGAEWLVTLSFPPSDQITEHIRPFPDRERLMRCELVYFDREEPGVRLEDAFRALGITTQQLRWLIRPAP
jgi:hypothetical protein